MTVIFCQLYRLFRLRVCTGSGVGISWSLCPHLCVFCRLLQLCQRTMALPVGRGFFTLFSYQPVPTEPLPLPKLNLTGNFRVLSVTMFIRSLVYTFFTYIYAHPHTPIIAQSQDFCLWFYFYCKGRAPPRNNTVDLNSGNIDVPPNMTSWASFHNGVAAGLKIAPASQVCKNKYCTCGQSFLQVKYSIWLVKNKT